MDIMIDTNVMLDVLLKREPFVKQAKDILLSCMKGEHKGYITTASVTDLFYIAGRQMEDLHILYLLLDDLFETIRLCSVNNGDVMAAMDQRGLDFEDCLVAVCARRAGCEAIITRNIKDFQNAPVRAITPEDFLREK